MYSRYIVEAANPDQDQLTEEFRFAHASLASDSKQFLFRLDVDLRSSFFRQLAEAAAVDHSRHAFPYLVVFHVTS
jgi:hypothetical protein